MTRSTNTNTRRMGFSLVELSVVLVILGLLAGGILAGQSMIHAASLRATITQMQDIDRAMNAFQDKYSGLPGDITNAATYWPGLTPAATNGNGDGIIEAANGTYDPDSDVWTGERPQFFYQLGLAGLTTSYKPTSTAPGVGYPAVKLNPVMGMFVVGSWANSNMGCCTASPPAGSVPSSYATSPIYLYLGICNTSSFGSGNSAFNDCAIFTAQDAWNIDKKLDDGEPTTGAVLGESYSQLNCFNPGTSDYNLNSTAVNCNLLYDLH